MTQQQPYITIVAATPTQLAAGVNTTGSQQSNIFGAGRGIPGSSLVQAIPNGSVSVCTFDLQISLVNGTWNTIASWDAIASPATILPIASVPPFRLNCTGFSGAGTMDVWGIMTQVISVESLNGGGGGGGGSVTQGTIPWVVSGMVGITQGGNTAVVTASGALKVDGSSVVQPTEDAADGTPGSIAPALALQIAGVDNSGDLRALSVNSAGALNIVGTFTPASVIRTPITFYIDAAAGVISEALATLTINKAGTVTTGTSYVVTAGKTLHLQRYSVAVQQLSTTVQTTKVRIRSAATVTITSPVFDSAFISSCGATNSIGSAQCDLADGIEIAASQQLGISHVESSSSSNVSVILVGYEY